MTKKKSLRSITKFHRDDIDYNITKRNYELVVPEGDLEASCSYSPVT